MALSNYRQSMEPGSGTIDDLATLTTLDEISLLREIQARYEKGIIYVSGSFLHWRLIHIIKTLQFLSFLMLRTITIYSIDLLTLYNKVHSMIAKTIG